MPVDPKCRAQKKSLWLLPVQTRTANSEYVGGWGWEEREHTHCHILNPPSPTPSPSVVVCFRFPSSVSICRKSFEEQLDLPTDNYHLPKNLPGLIITATKDDTYVKRMFKGREVTGLPVSSPSKVNEPVSVKKRKPVLNILLEVMSFMCIGRLCSSMMYFSL